MVISQNERKLIKRRKTYKGNEKTEGLAMKRKRIE